MSSLRLACNRQYARRAEGVDLKVVATEHLLSSMRHHVGRLAPGTKASHIAEALAFGLGHRTNASLRATLSIRPLDRPLVLELDCPVASRRLGELGGHVTPEAFSAAAAASLSAVVGTGNPDTETSPARFAEAAALLEEKMAPAGGGVVGFVEEGMHEEGAGLHLKLAASYQVMRDHDRDMADFLADFLLEADGEIPFDGMSRGRLGWGEEIFRGFAPRIGSLARSIRMAWPSGLGFHALEVVPQLVRRSNRPILVVEGRSDSDGEVGLADTGRPFADAEGLIGACCLARLRSGDRKPKIASLAARARNAGADLVEVCLAEVPYAGPGGPAEARSRLERIIRAATDGLR